jgi:hypothetical protein
VRKSVHVHRVSFSTLIRQNYSGAIEVHPSAEAAPRHLARHWERTILVDFSHRMILGTAQPHCAEVSRPPSSASGKPSPGVDESFQRSYTSSDINERVPMDPLSIAASTVTLIQVAGTVSNSVYHLPKYLEHLQADAPLLFRLGPSNTTNCRSRRRSNVSSTLLKLQIHALRNSVMSWPV